MLGSIALLGILATSSVVDSSKKEGLSLIEALEQSELSVALRARYEDVNSHQSGVDKAAQASTLRSRVSLHSAPYHFFSAYLELTNVLAVPDDDNYFDGSNGQFDDALVADPESTDWTQYWLGFDVANTDIRYGRQFIELDNGRFLGGEQGRQQRSTYSGLSAVNESLNFLRVRAGRLHRFESSLGHDVPGAYPSIAAQYLNLQYRGFIHSELSAYVYDFDSKDSSWGAMTQGLRFSGHIKNEPAIEYAFEYAQQRDAGAQGLDYKASYYLTELGVRYSGIRIFAGREVLGADGEGFFVTPLASLHDFQGWTDQFHNAGLGNITGGVADDYYSVGWVLEDVWQLVATRHEFSSDDKAVGYDSLGDEWNVEALYRYQNAELSVRYADYERASFGQDLRKVWVSMSLEY